MDPLGLDTIINGQNHQWDGGSLDEVVVKGKGKKSSSGYGNYGWSSNSGGFGGWSSGPGAAAEQRLMDGLEELERIRVKKTDKKVISRLILSQANKHYRNGNGTTLIVDASKVDLSRIDRNIFKGKKGVKVPVGLFGNSEDGLVYGTLEMEYIGNDRVKIYPNQYDFIISDHPWFDGNIKRNSFTLLGNFIAGPGNPYMINFEGFGDLNYRPKPFKPNYPIGLKY